MALTNWGFGNYLRITPQTFVGTYPFMLSAWGYQTVTTANRVMVVVDQVAADDRRGGIRVANGAGTGLVGAPSSVAGNNQEAYTSTASPLNTWFHCSGAFMATNSREARHTGGNLGVDAGLVSPAAAEEVAIGRNLNDTPWDDVGALAEISLWDLTGFAQADRTALDGKLAAGENPLAITAESAQLWSGKLLAYWALTNTTDITDLSGNGHHLSTVGTLTNFASHPTIDPLFPQPSVIDSILVGDTQYQPV